MQDLRLVLLLIGGGAILALVAHGLWVSRAQRNKRKSGYAGQAQTYRDKDGFDQDGIGPVRVVESPDLLEVAADIPAIKTQDDVSVQAPKVDANPSPKPQTQQNDTPADSDAVYVIHIVGQAGALIQGQVLHTAVQQQGLVFGDMSIFHRLDEGETEERLFSLINMVEPGVFDIETIERLTTPGVSLFMQIPKHSPALACWDKMLACAQNIADQLGAELMDASRKSLSEGYVQTCRQELEAIDAARIAS